MPGTFWRSTLLWVVGAVCAVVGSAQDAASTVQRALAQLEGQDSRTVAKALLDAHRTVHAELQSAEAERAEIHTALRELLRGQERAARPTFQRPDYERYEALKRRDRDARAVVDELRALLDRVRERIEQLRSEGAARYLLQHVVRASGRASGRDRDTPLELKVSVARALGATAELSVDELARALARARNVDEKISLCDALGIRGAAARAAAPRLITLLGDRDGAVRERAALALSRIAAPAAIDPMIRLLGRERGQARKRVAAALEVLTGQQHGTALATWHAWFKAEGAAYLAGEHELGRGTPSRSRTDEARGYYFEIPQDGKAMLYVIDASASMTRRFTRDTAGRTTTVARAETSRIEACKAELIRALARLSPDDRFNLLWYSDLPHLWSKTMVAAAPDRVQAGQDWVRQLEPSRTTNIHDSLQLAFTLTGRGARDEHYDTELDTIFLLTDGSPTTPDGKLDDTDKILRAVRAWNPLGRVTIHAIGIGPELNEPFLTTLARENGGMFQRH